MHTHPFLALFGVLGIYVAQRYASDVAFDLGEEEYLYPFLLPRLLRRPGAVVLLLLPMLVCAWRWRPLRWSKIDPHWLIRFPVLCSVVVLAWAFACYPHNHYFAQLAGAHAHDRNHHVGAEDVLVAEVAGLKSGSR